MQFKCENMLLLGLLPELNEISLHKINYYLAPIVNELQLLWSELTLDHTFKYSQGRKICAVLILVSCDILAARKICSHILALVSYY